MCQENLQGVQFFVLWFLNSLASSEAWLKFGTSNRYLLADAHEGELGFVAGTGRATKELC